jgi:hypothetical protein
VLSARVVDLAAALDEPEELLLDQRRVEQDGPAGVERAW